MLRRAMFAAVAGLVLSASNARAEEQVHRVGVLLSNQMGAAPRNAWLAGLRERGYVDGRNLQIDYRYHGGDVERMRALAAELAALAPELIVVGGRRPRSRCIPPPRPFRCSL
jgi:putative ABC transport system substrate-binding protein